MTAEEMWQEFSRTKGVSDHYEAWTFGGGSELADQLAQLVLDGIKTATASSAIAYETEREPIPEVGCYSVVLWNDGSAACIIRNTDVSVVPFDEVSELHAYREGEGDRTLRYWRTVHEPFFTPDYEAAGKPFDPHGGVVLEQFIVVWPEAAHAWTTRPMTEEDARAVCTWRYDGAYAVYNFSPYEDCIRLGYEIADESRRSRSYTAVLLNGELVGFLRLSADGSTVEIGLGLAPRFCGRGLGKELLALGESLAHDRYPSFPLVLKVRTFNRRALHCYEKAGYRRDEQPTPDGMIRLIK